MKHPKIAIAGLLATFLSLAGCCFELDFGEPVPGAELHMLGLMTSGTVSRQIESWDDFSQFDHTGAALVVAISDEIPPDAAAAESAFAPQARPRQMKWVLLYPQQSLRSSENCSQAVKAPFVTDVPWRVGATVETQIALGDSEMAIDALLELVETSAVDSVWFAPGFGPLLVPHGSDVRVGLDLPISTVENKKSTGMTVQETVIAQHAYTQFVWLTYLTQGIAQSEAFQTRFEPVSEHSYVFRVKPTQ